MFRKIAPALLLSFGLQAQEEVLPLLQSLVFASFQEYEKSGSEEAEFVVLFEPDEAVAVDVPLLEAHPEFLAEISQKYLGAPLTLAALESIQQDITRFYIAHSQPLVHVSSPEQDVTAGAVCFVVDEAKAGAVEFCGNRYFSTRQMEREFRTAPGGPINLDTVASDLSWINQNPFRQADVVLKAGSEPQATDLQIVVKDRFPYRFYAGGDNTGTQTTDIYRVFGGFNAGNLWGAAHQLSYQYTTAPSQPRFYAHTGEYLAPLPWRHNLRLFGSYSKSRPDFHDERLEMNAYFWQASLRYEVPLLKTEKALQQKVSFGLDFKRTNNDLQFGGDEVLNHNIDVADLRFSYNLGAERGGFRSAFELAVIFSPGGITPSNTNHAYQRLRPYAHSTYATIQGDWSASYFFSPRGWAFAWDLWGQGTTTNLMPSEQFLLGGYNTVRGYQQNQVTADDGIGASAEIHTPTWSFFQSGGSPFDALYFLAFLDYGWGADHKIVSGEKPSVQLVGTGPGVRYSLGHYLNARLDCGFPLLKSPYAPHLQQRWSFGVVASY